MLQVHGILWNICGNLADWRGCWNSQQEHPAKEVCFPGNGVGMPWLQACLLCLQAPCWHFFFQLELGFSLTCPSRRSEKQLLHLRVINLELRSQGYLVQQFVVWHLLEHLQWQWPRAYRLPRCRCDNPPLLRKGLWTVEYLEPNSTPNYQEWCVPDLCDPQASWKASAIEAASLLGHPYCCVSSPDVSVHHVAANSAIFYFNGESCALQFTSVHHHSNVFISFSQRSVGVRCVDSSRGKSFLVPQFLYS